MPSVPTRPPATARHAVLVGVNVYDHGIAAAVGADLDAVAWFGIARALGTPSANIDLYTSPARTDTDPLPGCDDGAPHVRAPAARAPILASIQTLVQTLRENPDHRGLLFYAGHGALGADGMILCPADVTTGPDGVTGGISLADILALIDAPLPGLTIVLDACFAGALPGVTLVTPSSPGLAGAPAPLPRTPLLGAGTPATPAGGAPPAHVTLAERVVILSATGADQEAYAYSLRPNLAREPIVHGVFTAAISALLQRWSPPSVAAEQPVPYPIAYNTLVKQAGAWLSALAFDQQPTVAGPEGVEDWHAFDNDNETTLATPPRIVGRELWGGTTDGVTVGVEANGSVNKGLSVRYAPAGVTATYLTWFIPVNLPGAGDVVNAYSTLSYGGYCQYAKAPPLNTPFNGATSATFYQLAVAGVYKGFVVYVTVSATQTDVYWFWMTSTLPTTFTIQAASMATVMTSYTTGKPYPLVYRTNQGSWGQGSIPPTVPAGFTRYYVTGGTSIAVVDINPSTAAPVSHWYGQPGSFTVPTNGVLTFGPTGQSPASPQLVTDS